MRKIVSKMSKIFIASSLLFFLLYYYYYLCLYCSSSRSSALLNWRNATKTRKKQKQIEKKLGNSRKRFVVRVTSATVTYAIVRN